MTDEELDMLARTLYYVRARPLEEMTDAYWEQVKQASPDMVRACREDVLKMHGIDSPMKGGSW